jgi:Cu/Ag efflux pump CusA
MPLGGIAVAIGAMVDGSIVEGAAQLQRLRMSRGASRRPFWAAW